MNVEQIINDIKAVRTGKNRAWVFNEDGSLNDNAILIDTVDIIEGLKEFMVDAEDANKIAEGAFVWKTADKCFNTYNWNAPVTNDMEVRGNDFMTCVSFHICGDARCNYTDYIILDMGVDEFLQLDLWYEFHKEVDGRYVCDLHPFCEMYNVYNYETQEDIGEFCESEVSDLLDAINNNRD